MKITGLINNDGFTLIEVMIALMVFSIGILAVGAMQITAIRGNDTAYEFTQALALGQSKLDTLMSLSYEDAENSSEAVGHYNLSWTVTEHEPVNDADDDAKRIALTVQWQDGTTTRQIALESVKMKNED